MKKMFVAYLPAGFPDFETSLESYKLLVDAKVDIIEMGLAYSDPVMDGNIIQNANNTVLKNGFTTDDYFRCASMVSDYIIKTHSSTKLYMMGYYNTVMQYTNNNSISFLNKASLSGITGTIIPDLPYNEAAEYIKKSKNVGLKNVFLVSALTNDLRLEMNIRLCSGFIYASSHSGTTGISSDSSKFDKIQNYLAKVKEVRDSINSDIPILVGLGVSSKADVDKIGQMADGAIVGSYFVNSLAKNGPSGIKVALKSLGL